MIKYNNNTINDWNFGTSNLIKVYRNNAIVFYKVSGESPTPEYKVCFAVVDDISQYQETEFEDVFDNATEKWYKLNNLNQYEEYGVYGSGRTSCDGSTSRLPQGYTEVEYIENTGTSYINTNVVLYSSSSNSFILKGKIAPQFTQGAGDNQTFINSESVSSPYYGFSWRFNSYGGFKFDVNPSGSVTLSADTLSDGASAFTITASQVGATDNVPLGLFCSYNNSSYTSTYRPSKGKLYSLEITLNNEIIRDLVPAKRDSDDKYGMYDLVTNTFYLSPNNVDFSGGEPITPTDCVTTYEGKLTIDGDYEYQYTNGSWVNVGEIEEGESRLPQGYTEVEYVQHSNDVNSTSNVFWTVPNDGVSGNVYTIDLSLDSSQSNQSRYIQLFGSTYGYCYRQDSGYRYNANVGYMTKINYSNSYTPPYDTKLRYRLEPLKLTVTNTVDSTSDTINLSTNRTITSDGTDFGVFNANMNDSGAYCLKGKIYSILIEDSNGVTKHNYVPCKRDSDDTVGLYDIVGNGFYNPSVLIVTAGEEAVKKIYPKYYTEKSEPLDDLTFNTLAEAQTYAYNNCVYDGMKATIGTDRYYFDSEDENGWVKILEYYKVEDVTPSGASGWTISGSSMYNLDSSYYDDFDLQTTSTSYATKIAKVTIYGYDHFTYYLRTSGYSNFCYVVATNVDEIQTPPASMSYNSSSAITNTYNWNKSPKSAVNLSNYRRVTYNNLDKTVEHTFYVYFYGRTYSSYVGNATILIPKDQSNENWEQVTFSASSNVASTQKSLYIDSNNSTSGGTNCWYNRWIVGLPSGSHSSYTNYSNYDYCPNTTSSTFTSVTGEQRQVNFTYDYVSNKTLSFRLTDGSNVLTPSDTVYYNMASYNSCGVSTNMYNLTFPNSVSVKVGGRFSFSNSSNRHYIYGYQPPTLGTNYYVDNYHSTFDIVYTKLNDEAVTITYTTYDPNDVETPAFNTDITYPYNGGITSSTTLTSFDAPYTYPYEVSQTSDKFSADSQSYTANQAARTINFTLYPNNREFASVAELEAYDYAWEGMTAYVGSDKYVYQNGEWVYNPSRLPQGYQEVEYVQNYASTSVGTNYLAFIDTNFKPNQDTRIVMTMKCDKSNNYSRFCGAGGYDKTNAIQFDYETGAQGTLHISWGAVGGWATYSKCVGDYNTHEYDWNKNYFYRDKGTANEFSASTTYTAFQCTDNLGIFTNILNGSGELGYNVLYGRLYSCQIYDNGTLIRDFVPCINPNNVVGVYDIVNNVFYQSGNGNSFVAGQEV